MRSYVGYASRIALHPNKHCIYAVYPHGLFATGTLLTFGLSKRARNTHVAAHSMLFSVPVVRELALWSGAIDATEKNIVGMLRNDKSVAIVPGGVQEMLHVSPGMEYKVSQKHDKFVEIAYRNRVALVPVYCKGENELYYTFRPFPSLMMLFKRLCKYPFPCFFLGPRPAKIEVVYGDAIACMEGELYESFRKRFFDELNRISRE
jgi:2-acylglycerol O-acyltransferase 2